MYTILAPLFYASNNPVRPLRAREVSPPGILTQISLVLPPHAGHPSCDAMGPLPSRGKILRWISMAVHVLGLYNLAFHKHDPMSGNQRKLVTAKHG